MKKSLLALAVLGAYAGVASAQSSVTLYGTIDLSAKYVKNDNATRRYSLAQDGINSSQLALKGTEDLGGGLKAGFDLRSGINPDSGTANSKFWNRRATVSLWGNFGEVRLGRDYTPTFWNNTIFDAFGTNGLGDSSHVGQLSAQSGTFVRADNSIGYFLPSGIGGVYGQVMAAAAEGGSAFGGNSPTNQNPGRYIGGRVGWAGGPIDVAGSVAQQSVAAATPVNTKLKVYNIGGAYDLGVVKLMGYFDRSTYSPTGADFKENRYSFSAVVPIGQSEIHAGYSYSKLNENVSAKTSKIDQFALGYVYNLSKRTAVYTTVSRVNNKDGKSLFTGGYATVGGGNAIGSDGSVVTNPKSTGAEFGLRHFF
jgi:predicted porin